MKIFITGVITFVIGLTIGAWGPRSDLLIMQGKLEEMKSDLRNRSSQRTMQPMMENVTKMMGLNRNKRIAYSDSEPDKHRNDQDQTEPLNISNKPRSTPVQYDHTHSSEDQFQISENMDENLEAAYDIWNLQSAQARALLIENLDLTETEIEELDLAIDTMNEQLKNEIEIFVNHINEKEMVTSEEGLRLMNSLTGVVLNTYQQMDDTLPYGWRYQTSEESDLMHFINPRVAEPFLEIDETKFGGY